MRKNLWFTSNRSKMEKLARLYWSANFFSTYQCYTTKTSSAWWEYGLTTLFSRVSVDMIAILCLSKIAQHPMCGRKEQLARTTEKAALPWKHVPQCIFWQVHDLCLAFVLGGPAVSRIPHSATRRRIKEIDSPAGKFHSSLYTETKQARERACLSGAVQSCLRIQTLICAFAVFETI